MVNELENLDDIVETQSIEQKADFIEQVHRELIKEVKEASEEDFLSKDLRVKLNKLSSENRRKVTSEPLESISRSPALYLSCVRGSLKIVDYLVQVCGADIEQHGIYVVPEDDSVHRTTSLWVAALNSRLDIVKYLVKYGANVNALSDTGSSALRSSCFMSNIKVCEFLIESGANVHIPNINGGNCLINSVQSLTLLELLVQNGANVNAQDIQMKTALHYAISEHRIGAVKFLITHGANPFIKSHIGDDALQTAALKGAEAIFGFLLEAVEDYTVERHADMLELLGTTFFDENQDQRMCMKYWRLALKLRESTLTPKKKLGYTPLYAIKENAFTGSITEIREFSTSAELDEIETRGELLKINSCLMAERILGSEHKDLIFRLMYRGAAFSDFSNQETCIKMWTYSLLLRIKKDSIIYIDSCYTTLALVHLFLHMDKYKTEGLTFGPMFRIFELLVDSMGDIIKLLQARPQYSRHMESFDKYLRCISHLIYLTKKFAQTPEKQLQVRRLTEKIVRYNCRMFSTGESLLHLVLSKNNFIKSSYYTEAEHFRRPRTTTPITVFPDYDTAKFLISCGANSNIISDSKSYPVHYLFYPPYDSYNKEMLGILLELGAHLDTYDSEGRCPLEYIKKDKIDGFCSLDHLTLKCIAAKRVGALALLPPNSRELPQELLTCVHLHSPPPQLLQQEVEAL